MTFFTFLTVSIKVFLPYYCRFGVQVLLSMSPGPEIGMEINRRDHDARSVHTHESILDQFLRCKNDTDIHPLPPE